MVSYDRGAAQPVAAVRAWAAKRAQEICGPVVFETADLFSGPVQQSWRSTPDPESRLMLFAGDLAVPVVERRQASEVLARAAEELPKFPKAAWRPIGMLMLVP